MSDIVDFGILDEKRKTLDELFEEGLDVIASIPPGVKQIYSFSGGKDSTTTAVIGMEAVKRGLADPNDVLMVFADVYNDFPNLRNQAINFLKYCEEEFGVKTEVVYPKLNQTYWVRFIGEGTFASNHFARWCVRDLKVNPIKRYFKKELEEEQDHIVVIGIRLDESAEREEKYKDVDQVPNYQCDTQGECFAPLNDEPRAFPILNWKNCDIWDFLMFSEITNEYPVENLREIYMGKDKVRYGCWNCTIVSNYDLLEEFVEKNPEYEPLLELRKLQYEYTISKYRPQDWLWVYREPGSGNTTLEQGKKHWIASRLTVETRKWYLNKLITAQEQIQEHHPEFKIVREEEIEMIKQKWEEFPDGDVKDRPWKYYDGPVQQSLEDFL